MRSSKKPDDSALVAAIKLTQSREVMQLLANGADIHQRDDEGFTPLMYAARSGAMPIIRLLLEQGAKINQASDSGTTPLTEAISNNHKEVVDFLVDAGADLQSFSYKKEWSFKQHRATTKAYDEKTKALPSANEEIVLNEQIVDKSGKVIGFTQRSKPESRESDHMSLAPLVASAQSGHDAMTAHLLEAYYDAENHTEQVNAALRAAAGERKTTRKTINLLLDYHASVEERNATGVTPLMYAARSGSIEVVQLLLDKDAQVNAVSYSGRTALTEAISNNRRKTVALLAAAGANLKPFSYMRKERGYHYPEKRKAGGGPPVTRTTRAENIIKPSPGVIKEAKLKITEKERISLDPLVESLRTGRDEMAAYLLSTWYDHKEDKKQINSALRTIVQRKNISLATISLLLKYKADVNGRDSNNFTPLTYAAFNNQLDIIELLLDNGSEVDAVSVTGKTPLLLAVTKGYIEATAVLLQHGASIASLPYSQQTPQGPAIDSAIIHRGKSGVGKSYVSSTVENVFTEQKSSAPSAADQLTQHPFDLAVQKNRKKIAHLFLDSGVRLPRQVVNATFPRVLRNGAYDLVDRLMAQGADVNMDMLPGIPLLNGVLNSRPQKWKRKKETVVWLCERGVNVQTPDRKKGGYTPLHHAARWGEVEIAEILLANGADINSRATVVEKSYANYDGSTPLVVAGNKEMIHFLLANGADPNLVNKGLDHPLLFRKVLTDPLTVKLLLEHGADPNVVDRSNSSPLFFAVAQTRGLESVRLLLEYGADPNHLGKELSGYRPGNATPLKIALMAENLAAARLLVEHDAHIRAECMRGMVVDAMNRKNDGIVRFLVESGAELNDIKGSGRQRGISPLMFAAHTGHEEYLQLFLENGADIDLLSKNGDTALIKAAASGSVEGSSILLTSGAQVDVRNSYGDTALFKAVQAGSLGIVKLLLAHDADLSIKNNEKLTPYWIAKQTDNPEIADFLADRGAETLSYYAFQAKIAALKANGIIPLKATTDTMTPMQLDALLTMIVSEFGIKDPKSHVPDPRLSSPARTWNTHKQALLQGDSGLFKKTLIRPDHPLGEIYEQITQEKREKMAEEMKPISPVSQDDSRAKFRIHRDIKGEEITFYIYFSKVFGEWKIDDY